jgi:hypothetical protein
LIAYLKLGAIALLAAVLFGGGFYFGGLRSKTALEADHAAMAKAATDALLTQAAQAAADHDKQQKVIDTYDATKDIPDPASVGTAHRVLLIAAADSCPVPEAGAVASGAPAAARVAIGPSEVERRLDDYVQACGRDVKKLIAAQALATK